MNGNDFVKFLLHRDATSIQENCLLREQIDSGDKISSLSPLWSCAHYYLAGFRTWNFTTLWSATVVAYRLF